MRHQQIYIREVAQVSPHTSVMDAARLMREKHVGTVVVTRRMSDGRTEPLGVLTDRDIVLSLGTDPGELKQLCVQDVMSGDLVVAYEDASLEEWIAIARLRGVRRLPVVDRSGALKGILSVDDLLEALGTELVGLAKVFRLQQRIERELRP